MGFYLFAVLVILEIVLAVRTCRKKSDKKVWRRDRLVIRAAETVSVIFCFVSTAAQKWRFIPVLVFLAVLLLIAVLSLLLKRNQEEGAKKPLGAVVSCVLCILFLGVFLIPAVVFIGYNGLPVSGPHTVGETSAILIDRSRTDPFEQDGSSREVPVHFYYPEDADEGERFPLIVFSHGAFGYYQSNTSTYMELASNGYVVAALDHPHHAFFTQDTDGKMVLVDSDFINTAMTLNNISDRQEQYALYTQWMALRTGDMNYAVDAVKVAVQNGTPDENWFYSDRDGEKILSLLRVTDKLSHHP